MNIWMILAIAYVFGVLFYGFILGLMGESKRKHLFISVFLWPIDIVALFLVVIVFSPIKFGKVLREQVLKNEKTKQESDH